MRGLLLYRGLSRVSFDCPPAQLGGDAQRPRSAATPGAVGLAGQNAGWSASTRRVRPASLSLARSVSAHQAHHFPLNADAIRPEDPRFIGRIGGLQRNRGAPFAQSLERRLLFVDQRDDDIARLSRVLLADD